MIFPRKAAAVGAALSVMHEYRLEEDDGRIPASTADIVGDTVGDIAGMEAVLFGSFAETTCAAQVLIASSDALEKLLESREASRAHLLSGIAVGTLTLVLRTVISRVRDEYGAVEKTSKVFSPSALCS